MERLDHDPNVVYHFSHPHPLYLSNAESLYTTSCSACNLQSHGWMYSCKPCNFTLHISCTQMPNLITHPSQQQQQRQQQQQQQQRQRQQQQQQASYQQTSGGHHGEDNGTLMHTMVQGIVEGVAHQVGETVAQSIINQDGGDSSTPSICSIGSSIWRCVCGGDC